MGRQVNFFMYGGDEDEFLSAARKHGDVRLLPDVSPSKSFEPLDELPGEDDPRWFHLWLWEASLCKPPSVIWVAQQHHYTIDGNASEVIEFSRSYERNGRLVRGRIWAEFVAWRAGASETPIEKSPAFRKWFSSLAGWIKKHYTRTSEGWYIGPQAEEFRRSGGQLVSADFAPTVKVVRH